MLNRKLQIGIVKEPKKSITSETTTESLPVTDITESAKQVINLAAEKIVYGVAIYIAMDTLRKVIVKNTPQR